MSPDDLLAAQRARQLAADRRLARDLASGYLAAWTRLQREISALAQAIETARARGDIVDTGWLVRRDRLQRLEQRTLAEVRVFADQTARRIQTATSAAQEAGALDAIALANAQLPERAQLEQASLTARAMALAEATRPGAPLALLLAELSTDAGRGARDALIEGVARGDGPRQIAVELKKATTVPLWRALRIARTEVIGAYRRAALKSYEASSVVRGWQWVAALDVRTCPVCIALHGTVHSSDEAFASHPSCRCTPAPLTVSWAELGVPDVEEPRLERETGEQWLRRQPESVQRQILGPGKLMAWRADRFQLADVVQPTQSSVWGPGVRERSLRDLLST